MKTKTFFFKMKIEIKVHFNICLKLVKFAINNLIREKAVWLFCSESYEFEYL